MTTDLMTFDTQGTINMESMIDFTRSKFYYLDLSEEDIQEKTDGTLTSVMEDQNIKEEFKLMFCGTSPLIKKELIEDENNKPIVYTGSLRISGSRTIKFIIPRYVSYVEIYMVGQESWSIKGDVPRDSSGNVLIDTVYDSSIIRISADSYKIYTVAIGSTDEAPEVQYHLDDNFAHMCDRGFSEIPLVSDLFSKSYQKLLSHPIFSATLDSYQVGNMIFHHDGIKTWLGYQEVSNE